jgi:hypothetical protein
VDDEPDITGSFSLALEDTGVFEVETIMILKKHYLILSLIHTT